MIEVVRFESLADYLESRSIAAEANKDKEDSAMGFGEIFAKYMTEPELSETQTILHEVTHLVNGDESQPADKALAEVVASDLYSAYTKLYEASEAINLIAKKLRDYVAPSEPDRLPNGLCIRKNSLYSETTRCEFMFLIKEPFDIKVANSFSEHSLVFRLDGDIIDFKNDSGADILNTICLKANVAFAHPTKILFTIVGDEIVSCNMYYEDDARKDIRFKED